MANRILTGIKPTGQLTLGNYIGVLKNLPKMTDNGECIFFIADLHALTLPIEPQVLRQNSIDLASFYLAAPAERRKNRAGRSGNREAASRIPPARQTGAGVWCRA